jgi:hypothetical protein
LVTRVTAGRITALTGPAVETPGAVALAKCAREIARRRAHFWNAAREETLAEQSALRALATLAALTLLQVGHDHRSVRDRRYGEALSRPHLRPDHHAEL